MKNYNNSKIYKIEPTCEYDEGDIYIGSTNREYLCQNFYTITIKSIMGPLLLIYSTQT